MQTPQEKKVILKVWLEKFKPASLLDTEHNGVTLYNYFEQNGYTWSFDNLTQACKNLGDIATGGKLQFAQKTIVKTVRVEVEKKQTPRELEHERIKEAQLQGFQGVRKITTEFDRYETENSKPTEAEQIVAAMRDLREQGYTEETYKLIKEHRGHTHGQTASQQEELVALRDKLIRAKASPEQILNAVKEKRDSYTDTSISTRMHGVRR